MTIPGSPGDQLAAFSVDGNNLTSGLNALMTSGLSGQYRVYSLATPGSTFAALADGSAMFSLALQGPVQNPVLFPPPDFVTDPSNGANLIFAARDHDPDTDRGPRTLHLRHGRHRLPAGPRLRLAARRAAA